ncbi:hypothetical protein [Caloranaerobacter ferrireducens]|uniref:hypothetical protein n=1 Tax=Caloranaerobacter ferrireducens TaxID=1323370 RepID=UPI00084D1054|nr:hypothetical protein [Caloranaerobacter ferrireducens]
MEASLDTDIIIHLYKSGKKDLFFSTFKKLYIYEYLVNVELKNNGSEIFDEFIKDVDEGRIIIITDKDLKNFGVKNLFDEYCEENRYLFDLGELYAIALAKAIGIAALVSDDTKKYGPHDTLLREIIEDVIPFAFYELLFLKYISSENTLNMLYEDFEAVNCVLDKPMDFCSRIKRTVRRFSQKYGKKRDREWIENYCKEKNIDFSKKMIELKKFLKNNSC